MRITQSYLSSSKNTTEMNGLEMPLPSLPLFQLSVSLWVYCYPALLLIGTFGNVMSIVIMRRMMTKESTINLFFIALAVGDLLVLYSGILLKWINNGFGVNIIDEWPALYYPNFCVYMSSGGFVSWILVCMTLQRVASVVWPHHVSRVFTRGRVIKVIVSVLSFQALLYVHHLYCIYVTSTTAMTGSQCIGMPTFRYVWFLNNVFIYLAMILTSVLPFFCLVVGNGVLLSTLIQSVREAGRNMVVGNPQLSLKRRRETNSVTVTIVVVSLTFVALTLPIFVYGVLYRFKDLSQLSSVHKAEIYMLYTVSSLMSSANSAINFYLYCLTGRRFREECVNALLCRATNDTTRKRVQ